MFCNLMKSSIYNKEFISGAGTVMCGLHEGQARSRLARRLTAKLTISLGEFAKLP